MPPEKVSTENMHHGHLQETDMVVGYVDALEAGQIKDGDLVMLATNGAGFSWGASSFNTNGGGIYDNAGNKTRL